MPSITFLKLPLKTAASSNSYRLPETPAVLRHGPAYQLVLRGSEKKMLFYFAKLFLSLPIVTVASSATIWVTNLPAQASSINAPSWMHLRGLMPQVHLVRSTATLN